MPSCICAENDITLTKSNSASISIIDPLPNAANGALILFRNGISSTSYYYGVVRVYYNGWRNLCDDYYYNSVEANVICHQLGYTGASSYSRAGLVRYDASILLFIYLYLFLVMVQTLLLCYGKVLTVLVVHTCLLLNAPTLLLLIVGIFIVTVMMLPSTAVR